MNKETAEDIASETHKNQLYGDRPYFDHVYAVVRGVEDLTDSETAVIVAWLHDTVEDGEVTIEYIRSLFGDEVATAVDAITRRKDEESYYQYMQRVYKNDIVKLVKIVDLTNSIRHCYVRKEKYHMIFRYIPALNYLLDPYAYV